MKRTRFALGTILAVIFTLLVGPIAPQLYAQGGTWATKTSMPTARTGLGTGVVNGVIYAVGGYNGGNYLGTVEAYDTATDTWTTKASMPTGRVWLSTSVVNGILYAVGGADPSGSLGTVEALDPTTNTWTTKASMPTARPSLSTSVVNGILYAVGGVVGSTPLGTVEAYDPATDTWTTKPSMPTPRYGLSTSVVNGVIYAVGGTSVYGNGYVGTVEAYDPSNDTWTTKASMPTARQSLGTSVANGLIYAVGGYNNSGFLGTVEAYDPASNAWTSIASMPTPRYALGTGVVNGVVYAMGGTNTLATYGQLASNEAFTPTTSTTNVSSSTNPSDLGDSVTFTVSVTSNGGTPTGSVTLLDGLTSLGTETLSSGQATFTASSLAAGSHNITAQYTPDIQTFPSSSGSLTESVISLANLASLSGNNTFTGSQTVNGTVSATSFVGDGSGLTGVQAQSIAGYPVANLPAQNGQVLTYDAAAGHWMPAPGTPGPQGPIGLTGATGAQGPIGLTGATGATGAQGPIGLTGATGPAGASPFTLSGSNAYYNAGNIGIGTSNPGAALEIETSGDANQLRVGRGNPSQYLNLWFGTADGVIDTRGAVNGLNFFMNGGPAMFLSNSGHVGIGTTNPAQQLDVAGSIAISGTPVIDSLGNWVGSPTGLVGPQGPIGLTGAVGATGAQGPLGLTGATGATGAQGPIGLTGATGATGSQGPAGTNGSGFNFRSAFDPSATYAVNDVTTFDGSAYVATAANSGPNDATPSVNPAWTLMAGQGSVGALGTWATKTPMPTPRQGLGTSVVNGVIYAVGGCGYNCVDFSGTVEAYDPASDTWTTKASMPTPRAYLGTSVVNGIIYAVGGRNSSGQLATVEAYDPSNNTWTTKTPMPTPRFGLSTSVVDGVIYAVVGGYTSGGSFFTTVEAYNPVSDVWTTKAPLTGGTVLLSTSVVNGTLYAIGGYAAVFWGAGVETYDPATDTWSSETSMPTSRLGLGTSALNGVIYTVGGYSMTGTVGTVEVYDPASNSWTTDASMPTPRYALSTSVVNGVVYAMGGIITGNITVATNEAFTATHTPPLIGDGSAITNLTAASISSGTAGISITGNAATATNALTVDGHSSGDFQFAGNYARLDLANSFVGNQLITGSVSASGGVTGGSLTISGTPVIDGSGNWVGNPTGLVGPQGPIGLTGATGAQGPIGLTGAAGATGAQGPIGLTGATGPAGASPFTLNGSSVYYNAGNVGIGTTTPGFPLDVNGSTTSQIVSVTQTGNGNGLVGSTSGAGNFAGVMGVSTGSTGIGVLGEATGSNTVAGLFVNTGGGALLDLATCLTCKPLFDVDNAGLVGITGSVNIGQNLRVAGTISGNGSGLTNLTATSATTASGLTCTGCVGNAQLGVAYAASASQGGPATSALSASLASQATNSLSLGGQLASNYARLDIGNNFTGNQNVAGNLTATGTVAIGSGGTPILEHLSLTLNLTFPALKPSVCTNLDFTFAGASDGDTVALGIPNAMMTVTGTPNYVAWVSAANTITVRACNLNPNNNQKTGASGTIRVDVWKH
jgi:energy-converting hydrogenase Eha subunit A